MLFIIEAGLLRLLDPAFFLCSEELNICLHLISGKADHPVLQQFCTSMSAEMEETVIRMLPMREEPVHYDIAVRLDPHALSVHDDVTDPECEMRAFHRRRFFPVKALLLRAGASVPVGPGIRTLRESSSIHKSDIMRFRLLQTVPFVTVH